MRPAVRVFVGLATILAFALASLFAARPSLRVVAEAVSYVAAATPPHGARELRAEKSTKSHTVVQSTKRRADRLGPADGLDPALSGELPGQQIAAALAIEVALERELRSGFCHRFAIEQHQSRAPPSSV